MVQTLSSGGFLRCPAASGGLFAITQTINSHGAGLYRVQPEN